MADQKRWFKVWGSVVGDPHFGELPLEDVARWTLLGAYVAIHGTAGRLFVPGEAKVLCDVLRVKDRPAALDALRRLPNVYVEEGADTRVIHSQKRYGPSYPQRVFEEGKSQYGGFTVTLANWRTYQEDSTAKDRMKTLRAKRRREVEPKPTSKSPPTPRTGERPARPARPPRGSVRSSVSEGSSGGEGDPLAEIQAPATHSQNGGPLAGVVGALMSSIAARHDRAVGFVPRAAGLVPRGEAP